MGSFRVMLDLLFGRSLRLQSGGQTLDLGRLPPDFKSPFPDGTYWIKRLSATQDLEGRNVVPVFTTEEAARRWTGDGDVHPVSSTTIGEALTADETVAAAIDPLSLEALRRGPDAPASGATWIRIA
jgi:type III secretion system (T3SS) SseB-like protein